MFPFHLAAAQLKRERDEAETSRAVLVLHLDPPPPPDIEDGEPEVPDWARFY